MILREGLVPLAATAVAVLVVGGKVGWLPALPLLGVLAGVAWIYWEHRPPVPADPRGLLSPIAGRVVSVGADRDPFLDRAVLRIRVRAALPGIVPLRSPTEGKVMDLFTRRGALGEPQRACAPNESPDCYGQWLRTDEGEDVVYVVSSHWPVSRARFDQAPGERVGQGDRSGFIYFASVADVLVPDGSRAAVEAGDRVAAGESVLARLARS